MPNVGDIKYEYNRVYVYVQPDAALGPGTWRVSNPDAIGGPSGGGTTGATYSFDGEPPINVDVVASSGSQPNMVTTSMDLKQLDDRS